MKLEDQVCSLEQAKKLKELAVKQESIFAWYEYTSDVGGESSGNPYIEYCGCVEEHEDSDGTSYFHSKKICSAFSVGELGVLMNCSTSDFCTRLSSNDEDWHVINWIEYTRAIINRGISAMSEADYFHAHTEANARAKMLIWLIENGKVKV